MFMVKSLLAGRYLLEEQIAAGGMGEVWRARDEVLQRLVAVKLLHDSLAGDDKAAERFRREALTAAQISHPNMANVFDYIEQDGKPGIVMEYVPSQTLAQRLAREQMPIAETVRIADDVLAALDRAHAAGIVHRDIKPANDVVMRALARDPADRYTSAAEMRAALDAAYGAPLEKTGVLEIEDPDQTEVLARAPAALKEPMRAKVGDAIPPAWWGKRVAK